LLAAILASWWLAACVAGPARPPALPRAALREVPASEWPRFEDDLDFSQLSCSIAMSLAYLRRLAPERPVDFGGDTYSVSHLIRSLEYFDHLVQSQPSVDDLNRAIAAHFRIYRSVGRSDDQQVLFTGYYEPLLQGSLTPSARYPIPVYSRPSDLVEIDLGAFAADLKGRSITGRYTGRTVIPYPTRHDIRQNEDFDRIAPPLVWLRDEVDLFVLQIQGSGRVELENGEQFNILFDSSNGRPYASIGRWLINQGRIPVDKISMQAIREYLQQNPEEAQAVLDHNARYIFFRKAKHGPVGALGQLLTPMRSLAVDRHMLPSAALAFISVPLPEVDASGRIQGWKAYRGFALAQDAGSAITGPGRIDLFMGYGVQAETAASHLKHNGALYFLILDPDLPSDALLPAHRAERPPA
jgi:membrane-bound lytic murein transglycosylase A